MNFKQLILLVGIILGLFTPGLQAHGDIEEYYRLSSTEIIGYFSGKTLYSVNQRTKANILTYLSKDGTVKQSIKASNIQRKGWWHPANNQLCLRWEKFGSEHCFEEVRFHDEEFYLVIDKKVETIINKGVEGDTTGF